jgi:kinesin family protein 1
LLADTVYSPLPAEFQASNLQQQQQQLSAIARQQKSIVAVEVQDQKNGATHYWPMSKFR